MAESQHRRQLGSVGLLEYTGQLVRLSGAEADVLCERPPRTFTDVVLHLRDDGGAEVGAAYGKVLPRDSALASGFRIRFTSLSDQAAAHLRSRTATR